MYCTCAFPACIYGAEIYEQAHLPFAAPGDKWNCLSAKNLEETVKQFDFKASYARWVEENGMVDMNTLNDKQLMAAYQAFNNTMLPGATFLEPVMPRDDQGYDNLLVIFGSYPSAEGGAAGLLACAAEGSDAYLQKPVWNLAKTIFGEDFDLIMVINLCNVALTHRLCSNRGILWLLSHWPARAREINTHFLR